MKHDNRNTAGNTNTSQKKTPTYGLVTGHSHQALLLDVGFGGGIAASGVESSVVDAQHHPVAQTLAAGHGALW